MRAEYLFRFQYPDLQMTPFDRQLDVDQENLMLNFNTNLLQRKLKIEVLYAPSKIDIPVPHSDKQKK